MNLETNEQILKTLQEIRDGQREVIAHLMAQRAAAEEEVKKSRAVIETSIGLQKEGLKRQRAVTLVAVPGILACMAAIAYLVLKYF